MKKNIDLDKIYKYKSAFEKLKTITYKDIYINDIGIRILGIHFMECPPDWSIKRHRHSFYEYHYVLQGNVFSTIEGTEYKVEAGNSYLMPPGTFHSHLQKNNAGHVGFAIRWEFLDERTIEKKENSSKHEIEKENIFDDLKHFSTWSEHISCEPLEDDKTILTSFMRLLEMSDSKGQPILMQVETVQLILRIFSVYQSKNLLGKNTEKDNPSARICLNSKVDAYSDNMEIKSSGKLDCGAESIDNKTDTTLSKKETNKHTASENRIINASIQFIQDNYCEQIDVFDVANSIHFSYSYLAKLFKRCTGETITQYTNRLRVNKAFKMIKCTDKKISQIARETGFSTPNYFCMVFRKQFGKTPESVREEPLLIPE